MRSQERPPARGPPTWLAAAGLPLRLVPAALCRRLLRSGALSRGVRLLFCSKVLPGRARQGGQRSSGPAAATRRQGARPARPRAAASSEAAGRRAEENREAKLALKDRRRTRPGATPAARAATSSSRQFSRSSRAPLPQQPPHLGRRQWRPLPRRRQGRVAWAVGSCSSRRHTSSFVRSAPSAG